VTKDISLAFANMVTPKAGAKFGLLFNKLAFRKEDSLLRNDCKFTIVFFYNSKLFILFATLSA
jgi:hypothetical protein